MNNNWIELRNVLKRSLHTSLFIGVMALMVANIGSAPNGYTGSGGDGKTCGTKGGCHGGGVINQSGAIVTDVPVTGYIPNTTYNVSVTVKESGTTKFGFSITAEDDLNVGQGVWIANSNTNSTFPTYITHVSASTFSNDSNTWVLQWTAPSSDVGYITFFAAFIAADDDTSPAGDQTYASVTTVNPTPVNGLFLKGKSKEIKVFPTVFEDIMTIQTIITGVYNVGIYDLRGVQVYNKELVNLRNELSLTHLKPGGYIVKIQVGDESIIRKVLKK